MPRRGRFLARLQVGSSPLAAALGLLAAALGLLAPSAARADPLAVDASAFPQVRIYLPTGEPLPVRISEDGIPVAAEPLTGPAERTPLLAALVLDTSGSMAAALPQVQAAAQALIGRLGTGDRLALVRFSSQVEVISPPTADRAALNRQIAALKADGATALYDAVWAGVRQAREPPGAGLRAVVLLTDGKDEGEGPAGTPGSALRFEPLRQQLASAGVPLFILGLGQEVDRDVLRALASASGGRAFFADRAGDVQSLLDSLAGTLLATRGLRYLSPRPAPDGSRRKIEGSGGGGAPWQLAYLAPRQAEVLWRWPVAAANAPGVGRRRAVCGVGALSPAGTWALAYGPLTLLRGDGAPQGTLPGGPGFRPERASVLEDSSGFLIGGVYSALASLEPGGLRYAAEGPRHWVAVAPSGGYALRFVPQSAGASALLQAVEAVTDTPLWTVPCPGPNCDRLAGAALSDEGAALINQTGTLYRIGDNGKISAPRPEVFFGPVSLSADGRRGAAVVWQGGPVPGRTGAGRDSSGREGGGPRALLLDEALKTLETLPVQAANADLPPVAALSPDGRYLAVLDDLRLAGLLLGEAALVASLPGERRIWRTLGAPAPAPAPCERTLQIDNGGHVLVSDGDALTLLRGFAGP